MPDEHTHFFHPRSTCPDCGDTIQSGWELTEEGTAKLLDFLNKAAPTVATAAVAVASGASAGSVLSYSGLSMVVQGLTYKLVAYTEEHGTSATDRRRLHSLSGLELKVAAAGVGTHALLFVTGNTGYASLILPPASVVYGAAIRTMNLVSNSETLRLRFLRGGRETSVEEASEVAVENVGPEDSG